MTQALCPQSVRLSDTGGTYNSCIRAYEAGRRAEATETSRRALLHGRRHSPRLRRRGKARPAPDEATGCLNNVFQNGDLDFDGYSVLDRSGRRARRGAVSPSSFVQSLPTVEPERVRPLFAFLSRRMSP